METTRDSVDGRFASARPGRIDQTLDLTGTWIVPPFGEAHNHNIDGAVESRSREALRRYLADGVFYVKIQGNYPLTDEVRQRLPMNRPDAPDVLLAQAFLTASDAKLAAERGIVVITTILGVTRAPENLRPVVRPLTAANLKVLHDHGVRLVVGSDNVADTSALEFEQLATLGVFDRLTLLKMWAEATPRAIFPERQIGLLQDGYEASFLALSANPLEDLSNLRRIQMRFKQGVLLQ